MPGLADSSSLHQHETNLQLQLKTCPQDGNAAVPAHDSYLVITPISGKPARLPAVMRQWKAGDWFLLILSFEDT
jgi:hypothetical protein